MKKQEQIKNAITNLSSHDLERFQQFLNVDEINNDCLKKPEILSLCLAKSVLKYYKFNSYEDMITDDIRDTFSFQKLSDFHQKTFEYNINQTHIHQLIDSHYESELAYFESVDESDFIDEDLMDSCIEYTCPTIKIKNEFFDVEFFTYDRKKTVFNIMKDDYEEFEKTILLDEVIRKYYKNPILVLSYFVASNEECKNEYSYNQVQLRDIISHENFIFWDRNIEKFTRFYQEQVVSFFFKKVSLC